MNFEAFHYNNETRHEAPKQGRMEDCRRTDSDHSRERETHLWVHNLCQQCICLIEKKRHKKCYIIKWSRACGIIRSICRDYVCCQVMWFYQVKINFSSIYSEENPGKINFGRRWKYGTENQAYWCKIPFCQRVYWTWMT